MHYTFSFHSPPPKKNPQKPNASCVITFPVSQTKWVIIKIVSLWIFFFSYLWFRHNKYLISDWLIYQHVLGNQISWNINQNKKVAVLCLGTGGIIEMSCSIYILLVWFWFGLVWNRLSLWHRLPKCWDYINTSNSIWKKSNVTSFIGQVLQDT